MEVRPGYKQTEVGVIPDEWDAANLDVVCSMKSGEGITAAKIDQFSEYPCYGGNGLRGYTSRYTHDGSFALIGRQGALCGNVVGAEGKFFASEHAVVVTARSGIDIRFLMYVLGAMRLNRFSESSAQPGLSVSKVLKLQLAIPRAEREQRAIATALSDVDALLGGLDRRIAKKRDLKQAAMQQLLTGQTRLPGFHGEWEVKRLGDVCRITTGKKDVNEGNPSGQFPFFTCSRFSTFSDSYSFDTEAILIAGNGEVGNLHYFNGKFEAYQRTYVLSEFSAHVQYLWQQLSAYLADSLGLGKIGSSIPYIKKENLVGFEFNGPRDPTEQAAIASVLSDMDAELSALEARRDKTHALKQAMMQELLTGKTRLVPAGGAHA